MECYIVGVLEFWSVGALEYLLESWSLGVMECWSTGGVECSIGKDNIDIKHAKITILFPTIHSGSGRFLPTGPSTAKPAGEAN